MIRITPILALLALAGCTGTGDLFVDYGTPAEPPRFAPPTTVPTDLAAEWGDSLREISAGLARAFYTGENPQPWFDDLRRLSAEIRKYTAGAGALSSVASGAPAESSPAGAGTTCRQPDTLPEVIPTPEDPDVMAVRLRGEAELDRLPDGPTE